MVDGSEPEEKISLDLNLLMKCLIEKPVSIVVTGVIDFYDPSPLQSFSILQNLNSDDIGIPSLSRSLQ